MYKRQTQSVLLIIKSFGGLGPKICTSKPVFQKRACLACFLVWLCPLSPHEGQTLDFSSLEMLRPRTPPDASILSTGHRPSPYRPSRCFSSFGRLVPPVFSCGGVGSACTFQSYPCMEMSNLDSLPQCPGVFCLENSKHVRSQYLAQNAIKEYTETPYPRKC